MIKLLAGTGIAGSITQILVAHVDDINPPLQYEYGSSPAVQFRVNYRNGGIFYRSARDGYGFEADWSEFYTTTRKPSAGDVGAYTKAESDSRYVRDIRLALVLFRPCKKA